MIQNIPGGLGREEFSIVDLASCLFITEFVR